MLGLIQSIGRAYGRKGTPSLSILASKSGSRNYYRGKKGKYGSYKRKGQHSDDDYFDNPYDDYKNELDRFINAAFPKQFNWKTFQSGFEDSLVKESDPESEDPEPTTKEQEDLTAKDPTPKDRTKEQEDLTANDPTPQDRTRG